MTGKVSIAIISISIVVGLAVFALTSVTAPAPVFAANSNLTTNVTITGVPPTIGTITCSPISGGNFTPDADGTNKTLYCWAILSDDNGYGDITQSTLDTNFYSDTVDATPDDLNTHYSNGSASNAATDCTWTGESGNDITVNCSYTIRYYIDPSSSGWTINFTVQDTDSTSGSNTTIYGVATTTAFNVTQESIEYGELALGAISPSSQTTEITNWCNQKIDVKLRESQNSGYLNCSGTGSSNITTNNATNGIRFNMTTGFTWADGTSLTGSSVQFTGFDLDYYNATGITDGEEKDDIYWKIKIPATGVSGTCTGQTEFIVIAG